ncbi:Fpg/Nei family DNA glycosylase [Frigoribacterium faeni]|uniref:Formamidopyrimidine-DNA glycosylase n=1 Tax=Frigoribacterium faeni TaxID=145483 RepID=A0A7W3JGF7_9MICO|nr:Fpg/Nei family DNA glycosylase [Frigoribacterium faeni]MBA8812390.1 formamidopyrimidine-DNA glycosylase [Frigoribacterium faeni]BFF13456.1 bifunctional DNA-formamidopyrimidine glycosylase/DNA-(apurinic or apyrimidinic site) lyase [Microbacterium flavescens]GEK81897.1 formamidopyrimidine-DNA glycosylase [Frigoribacterium faeni]
MPELPEVEVVRAGLQPVVSGAVVSGVEILDPRSLKRHGGPSDDFVDRLVGGTIDAAVRRGKFLWFPFEPARAHDEPLALVAHLGMSGQVLLRDRDAEPDRLMRIRLDVESPAVGPIRLAFVDQRIFGSMALDETVPTLDGRPAGFAGPRLLGSDPDALDARGHRDVPGAVGTDADPADWVRRVPHQVSHIARDPLDPAFDERRVIARLLARRTGVKRALLDQGLLSGVGNIYADESLWAARVHPEQPTESLSAARARVLLAEVRVVLLRALGEGGTSFDAQYVNVNGQSGYFSHSLNAYGRQGETCPRCGTPIVREAFMNRSSHFCPRCQRVR